MKLTVIKPYNDESMIYDSLTKQYVLTLAYVRANFDVHFMNDEILETRIKKNSRKIYNFIFAHSNSQNYEPILFLLNFTKNGREFLLRVLTEQMDADNQTGYNDLSQQPAINLTGGKDFKRDDLIENQICVDAEQIIDNSASYFNIPICYQGVMPFYLFQASKMLI